MGTVFLGSAIAPQLTLVSYQDTFKCFSYNNIQNKAQELDKVGKMYSGSHSNTAFITKYTKTFM